MYIYYIILFYIILCYILCVFFTVIVISIMDIYYYSYLFIEAASIYITSFKALRRATGG